MSVLNLSQHGCRRAVRQQAPLSSVLLRAPQHFKAFQARAAFVTINHKRQRLTAHEASSIQQTIQRRKASELTITGDAINPPARTRSAPLTKPERGSENVFAYWWRVAKAYGGFYKAGIRAIGANRKDNNQVVGRLAPFWQEQGITSYNDKIVAALAAGRMTRAEFQLMQRYNVDMPRVPLFIVLVILLGEWLVFIVPFVPYLPPLTCRIPDVVAGMRAKTEKRRSWSFRKVVQEPDSSRLPEHEVSETPKTSQPDYVLSSQQRSRQMVQALTPEQLYHISCSLNLHSQAWERIQLTPPLLMMRSRIAKRLTYLTQDDELLSKNGKAEDLVHEELAFACEERGLDVLHPSEDELVASLQKWLDKQKDDHGSGQAMLEMLFRRPNAWK